MAWKPITRGEVDPEDVQEHPDPRKSGLFEARIPLSEEPPDEWAEAFERGYNASTNPTLHPIHLEGDEVVITPPYGETKVYLAAVDERIAAANDWYEKHVLPGVMQREQRIRAEEDEKARKLEQARRDLRGDERPKPKR